jgi:hypothetical protein
MAPEFSEESLRSFNQKTTKLSGPVFGPNLFEFRKFHQLFAFFLGRKHEALPALLDHSLDVNNKMNSNNNNNMMSNNKPCIDMTDKDEEVVHTAALAAATVATSKNWPQMKKLCTEFAEVALKLLDAVDECECTEELNANNTDNPKGNKWSKLLDVCFGGGSEGRGLLAGYLPQMSKSTKLKQKVMDMWAYVRLESNNPNVHKHLIRMALRQEDEYNKTKADEKAASDKVKTIDAENQEKMKTYEAGLGALPPSANGNVGMGRAGHSTNLKTNEPAAYSFARGMTQRPDGNDVIDVDDEPKSKSKAKVSTGTTNGLALDGLKDMSASLQKTFDVILTQNASNAGNKRDRELTLLYEQQSALEKSMMLYQKFPGNQLMQEQLDKDSLEFIDVSNQIKKRIALLAKEKN